MPAINVHGGGQAANPNLAWGQGLGLDMTRRGTSKAWEDRAAAANSALGQSRAGFDARLTREALAERQRIERGFLRDEFMYRKRLMSTDLQAEFKARTETEKKIAALRAKTKAQEFADEQRTRLEELRREHQWQTRFVTERMRMLRNGLGGSPLAPMPPGGGGSGGGGGGGGNNGGGGFSGAAFGAILGAAAGGDAKKLLASLLGATGGAIGEALGGRRGGIIGSLIAEVAGYMFAPAQGAAQASKSAIDTQNFSYATARAGGFRGSGLYNLFQPGSQRPQGWMETMGVTPQDVMRDVSGFGIAQSSAGGAFGTSRMLESFMRTRAYSGMEPSDVIGLGRQGAGYGNDPATFLTALGRVFEQANIRALDRSRILESMQSSMQMIAQAGAVGVSPGAIADLTYRMSTNGTPGGRTGTTALAIAQGSTGVMSNIGGNQLTSVMLMTQLGRFGGLRSPADVQSFVGGKVDLSGPQAQRTVSLINEAARRGDMFTALQYASTLAMGDPGRLQELIAPAMAQMGPGYKAAQFYAGAGNVGLPSALAATTTPGANLPAGTTAGSAAAMRSGSGLTEADARQIIQQAIPGVRITGGGRSAARNRQVKGARNSMHLSGQALDFTLPRGVNAAEARRRLSAAGVPISEWLDEPRIGDQGPHMHWGWRGGQMTAAQRDGLNLPPSSALQAQAGQQDLFTANASLQTLGKVATGTTEAFSKLNPAVLEVVPLFQAIADFFKGVNLYDRSGGGGYSGGKIGTMPRTQTPPPGP